MNNKVFCVMNTKGGVGKSIISKYVLPALVYDPLKKQKINVFEIDGNNSRGRMTSKHINYALYKIDESEKVIFNISFSEEDESIVNIIDVGGGDDMKSVLHALKNIGIENINFVIPTSKDDEQFYNVKNSIELINQEYPGAKIWLVMNYRKCESSDMKDFSKEFPNFFGKEEWGFDSLIEEIIGSIHEVCSLPNTDIFLALKNQYKTTLLDMYIEAVEVIENQIELRRGWKIKGYDYFCTKMKELQFLKAVVDFVETAKESFPLVDKNHEVVNEEEDTEEQKTLEEENPDE